MSQGVRYSETALYTYSYSDVVLLVTPCVHAQQGVKQSVSSVSHLSVCRRHKNRQISSIYACCKYNESIDIGVKMVSMRFELLKTAY